MSYKKIYPSRLNFDFKNDGLHVVSLGKTHYNPELWGIKYCFDQEGISKDKVKIYIESSITEMNALRMYFIKYLFPDFEFHDAENDKFIATAEEIIKNVGIKYITYSAKRYSLNNRGTKDKLESLIEKEISDNLSAYIPDFSPDAKVIRQFPANIFKEPISKDTRVTKFWIDMLSENMKGDLAPVELKVGGNIPLDLFAQGLDYGIYCHLFNMHIRNNWFKENVGFPNDKITIYYVGEEFHPALVGRGKEKGIISLIKKNELFNIVFVKIKVDKSKKCIVGQSEIIFDTRKQCNS